MTGVWKSGAVLGLALGMLSACGEQELILEGERLDLRASLDAPLDSTDQTVTPQARAIQLPATVANANWTHKNGSPQHSITHPALERSLTRVWSANIGAGNSRKHRITADPVVADGRVFTLDSRATVTAVSTSGSVIWSRDLTPSADNPDDASGGGLAVAGGTLFVTTGFGALTALDVATGATLWVQELDASATGAPTAANGAAYVVTRNATGWAVDAATGRILWQVFGAPSDSDILGGPSPAIAGPLVVFPFASGQMIAVVASTGSTAWVASVAGRRPERAFSRVSDLSGDPVYDGTRVYAGNHSGRMAAVDAGTGQLAWSANEGALSPVWRAGDSVFALTDENRLVRLDAANGEILWTAELPLFTRDRIRRRKATFAHFGPILAGGRLIVVSDDQQMREYDPASGALIALRDLPDGAARNPVVAAGTLYLVTANGQLHAFR